MAPEFTSLRVEEPSTPEAGAILIADAQGNDIAEFFHCEHATVPQSYEAALSLARMSAAGPQMFGALTNLVADLGIAWEDDPLVQAAKSALAAASGEA